MLPLKSNIAQTTYVVKKANASDVREIRQLIDFYAKEAVMLPRSQSSIMEHLRDFIVLKNEFGKVVACVALQIFTEELAEIRSLAVHPEFQNQSLGRRLVEACLEEAKKLKLKKVFTLTYVDTFFEKLGFYHISKASLPQKIWRDCFFCSFRNNCKEIALEYRLI